MGRRTRLVGEGGQLSVCTISPCLVSAIKPGSGPRVEISRSGYLHSVHQVTKPFAKLLIHHFDPR
jgi:hypothetical protein